MCFYPLLRVFITTSMKTVLQTQPAAVTRSPFLPKRQSSGVVAMGTGWEFANQFLHMQYLLEKIRFAKLVDNHCTDGQKRRKGEEERKEEKR